MVPKDYDHLFSEKVWRMKGNVAPWTPKSDMGHVGKLPAIKNGYVTFGSLTRGIRLNDRVVKVWSQILKKSSKFKTYNKQSRLQKFFIQKNNNRKI